MSIGVSSNTLPQNQAKINYFFYFFQKINNPRKKLLTNVGK